MIDFIIGDIVELKEGEIVILTNNIGYRIFTSNKSSLDLYEGAKNIKIYTDLIPREDSISLYGFTSLEELYMFRELNRVSRIGPKVALGILSTLEPNEIKLSIINKDKDRLSQAPGIGKKTAERIILELKDRISIEELRLDSIKERTNKKDSSSEAIEALISLGYSRFELEKALLSLDIIDLTTEEIIKQLLKVL